MIFLSIATKLTYLNETKDAIKNAIIEKGVSVSDNDTFRSYASKIADIEPTLGTKTLTANGTYNASDDSLQGYSSVTVDIDDTDIYRDTTDSTYESVKTLSNCGAFPMLSLTAEINAVQDLHGYDRPWAGGAGKNKFDSDTVLSAFTKNNNKYVGTPSRIVDDYVISGGFKTNTRYTLSYKAYNNTSTASNFRFIFSYTDGTEEIIGFVDTTTEKVIVGTSAENKTISKIKRNYGNGVELTLYDIQLEEGSTATSYAPYSNICPISGWDECNVSVCGVNVWDEEWESGGLSDANGTETTNTNYVRSDYIPIKGGLGIYGYSNDARQVVVYLYDYDKSYIGFRVITNTAYTLPNKTAFFRIRINNTRGEVSELTKGIVSINYPSTDTEYHAYNGQTYTIQFKDGSNPLTVYGGTLDVTSGVLTVDRMLVDMGTLNWNIVSWHDVNYIVSQTIRDVCVKPSSDNIKGNIICSNYPNIPRNSISTTTDKTISLDVNGNINVIDSNYATTSDFTTAMNGVQLVYELATPITYQLTPTQVKLLLGVNNLWADSGDVGDARYFRKVEL